MSLIKEYLDKMRKGWSSLDLESELLKLVSEYNKIRSTYLFVYASAAEKPIPAVSLEQSDFYVIRDLLADKKGIQKQVDLYIETPGGRGETAEEIVKFLHKNFDKICFVISGEAKSAGTIIVLSGDEILMTETGSLGPIDAQMKIGRSVVSAYDYKEWVDEKRKEAEKQGSLNPFDATMVAQISPGELGNVFHALEFAKDLVKEWLVKYKFKNWTVTETRGIAVTEEMKRKRAEDIATKLTARSMWRLHGRSIKIDDLVENEIRLKIIRIDKDPKLAEIVYRIQTVCRLLFDSTNVFKIFATQDNKIFRQAVPTAGPAAPKIQAPDVIEIEQNCPKCGKIYKIYAKLNPNPQIDIDFKKKGLVPFPKDAKIKCDCNFEIDLLGIKNDIEIRTGKKIAT